MAHLLSLYSVSSFFILDSDGARVLAKYYNHNTHNTTDPKASIVAGAILPTPTLKTVKEQRAFETAVWQKTKSAQAGEIVLYNGELILYKPAVDVTFYICGDGAQNELMLQSALFAFYDAASQLLRHSVEKRAILENLDLVVLCLDETIDDGIILETDSAAIAARVSKPRQDVGAIDLNNITINEQTIMAAFSTVRDRMAQRILNG